MQERARARRDHAVSEDARAELGQAQPADVARVGQRRAQPGERRAEHQRADERDGEHPGRGAQHDRARRAAGDDIGQGHARGRLDACGEREQERADAPALAEHQHERPQLHRNGEEVVVCAAERPDEHERVEADECHRAHGVAAAARGQARRRGQHRDLGEQRDGLEAPQCAARSEQTGARRGEREERAVGAGPRVPAEEGVRGIAGVGRGGDDVRVQPVHGEQPRVVDVAEDVGRQQRRPGDDGKLHDRDGRDQPPRPQGGRPPQRAEVRHEGGRAQRRGAAAAQRDARDEAQRAGEPPRVLAGRAGHQCGPMRGAERDGRGGHDDDDERDLTPWVTPSVHGATVDLLP